ncbi:type 4 fimbrial biogenesis protein PilY1, partial [Ectothiorhodospira sp. PHS-1]
MASVNIANSPLFVTSSVEPNILFIIDDSGSMMWETIPDEFTYKFFNGNINSLMKWVFPRINNLHGGGDYHNTPRTVRFTGNLAAQARSHQINPMYYNPAVTYRPWVNADGTEMPAAPPAAAPNRPLFTTYGTRNLTVNNSWNGRWWNDNGTITSQTVTFFPATYYYLVDDTNPEQESSYQRTEIRPENEPFTGEGREKRSDCTAGSCTYDQEIQNFANWYTYHRNRIFASRAGIGRAFSEFDGGMRVGYGSINHNRTTTANLDGVAGRTVIRGVRNFTGSHKEDFFDQLYRRVIPTEGTPLRRALEGAGEYFSRTDSRGPWSSTPGEQGGVDLACRQSFTILMTDGYTTGNLASSGYGAANAARRANTDGDTSG